MRSDMAAMWNAPKDRTECSVREQTSGARTAVAGLLPVAASRGFVPAGRLHVGLAVTGGVEEPTQPSAVRHSLSPNPPANPMETEAVAAHNDVSSRSATRSTDP